MPPIRIKVIVAIASGVGIAAGALTYVASRSFPQALLAAGSAAASSADLLRQLVDAEPEPPVGEHHNKQDDNRDGIEQKRT